MNISHDPITILADHLRKQGSRLGAGLLVTGLILVANTTLV